jgi:uncharacterized membrane protein
MSQEMAIPGSVRSNLPILYHPSGQPSDATRGQMTIILKSYKGLVVFLLIFIYFALRLAYPGTRLGFWLQQLGPPLLFAVVLMFLWLYWRSR